MEILRRDFMKGAIGVVVGGLTSLANGSNRSELGMSRREEKERIRGYMEKTKLDRDWDRAIEENNLRDELAKLIGEHTWISYRIQGEGYIFRRIIGKQILGADLPVENLLQLKRYLLDFQAYKNNISINLGIISM